MFTRVLKDLSKHCHEVRAIAMRDILHSKYKSPDDMHCMVHISRAAFFHPLPIFKVWGKLLMILVQRKPLAAPICNCSVVD